MYTEFVSATGLLHEVARVPLVEHLVFEQLFGREPSHFHIAARVVAQLGFDGVDLNFGCPDKSVSGKQGAGSALIAEPTLAQDIVLAAKAGVAEGSKLAGLSEPIPVSVKTRIGVTSDVLDTWLQSLMDVRPASITIHGRTRQEMSRVPAHWDVIARGAAAVRASGLPIVYMGNGDAMSYAHALDLAAAHGVDGVMMGRASFGTPWLFDERTCDCSDSDGSSEVPPESGLLGQRMLALLRHTMIWHHMYTKYSLGAFEPVRKCYQSYASGFPGAKQARSRLLTSKSAQEAVHVVLGLADSITSPLPAHHLPHSPQAVAAAVVAPPLTTAAPPSGVARPRTLLAELEPRHVTGEVLGAAAQAALDCIRSDSDSDAATHDGDKAKRNNTHPVAQKALSLLREETAARKL